MKHSIPFFLLFVVVIACKAQTNNNDVINAAEAERIERILSSDEMQGRKVFTAGIDKAATFIADEFRKAGLQTWNGQSSYLQTFTMVRPSFVSAKGNFDGIEIDGRN